MAFPTPYSHRTYPGNGIQTGFTVPFPFLLRQHVRVYLNWEIETDTQDATLVPGVNFNWVNDGLITTVLPVANGTSLSVVRVTPIDDLVVDWQAGSPPTAAELSAADRQVFFAVQEFIDRSIATQGSLNVIVDSGATTPINNLFSSSLAAPLAANQGRVLKELIDDLAPGGGGPGGFTQDGAGAVTRAVSSKLKDTVTPRDFGAIGNGITEDGPAIQTTLNSGARIIDGQGLTYKVSQRLTISSDTILKNCVFDMTGMPTGTAAREIAIRADGTQGTSEYNLTADAIQASGTSPSITLASGDVVAAGLAAGDLIVIRSNDLWTPTLFVSEMATVLRVSGGTVFLQAPLTYGYTIANSARIRKINPAQNITLQNIRANGPSPLAGSSQKVGFFGSLYARDIWVDGCEITNFNRAGVEFRQTYNCWMTKCTVTNIVDFYGCLVADGTSYAFIDSNSFENTRHGISVGGSDTFGSGICNFLFFTRNVSTSLDAALDTHPPADNVIFANNICRCKGGVTSPNGIIHQGRNIVISDNMITGFGQNGVTIQPFYFAPYAAVINITGNNIACDNTAASAAGIYIQTSEQNGGLPTTLPEAITITGNTVSGAHSSGGIYIKAEQNVNPLLDIAITGNTVKQSPTAISIRCTDASIRGVSIAGNSLAMASTGISLRPDNAADVIDGVAISGNVFRSITTATNRVGSGTARDVSVTGNSYDTVTTILGTALTTTTISSLVTPGTVTLNGSFGRHSIDTEAAAASDDLERIEGGFTSMLATFHAVSAARVVTFKDNTGNLRLLGDFTAASPDDSITCVFNGTNWLEVARSHNTATAPTVIIAAGVATIPGGYDRYLIDTEASDATDDLVTINGGSAAQTAVFTAFNAARTVVFKDGTGNLRLEGDFTADSSEDTITLMFNGSNWLEVARSNNSA